MFFLSHFPYKQISFDDNVPSLKYNDYNLAYLYELFDNLKHSNHTNKHILDPTNPVTYPDIPINSNSMSHDSPYLNHESSPPLQNPKRVPSTNHNPQVN